MQDLRTRAALALATLTAALCVAAPAHSATVSVRVEGQNATLVPRTVVNTTATPVNKDGDESHTCSGTSAAGALELATAGQWNGPWFTGMGYSVYTIKGETYDFSTPDYWAFWLNNRSASTGICGAELAQGDEVLFFVDRCVWDESAGACADPVFPLALFDVPPRVERGRPFRVRVVRYDSQGQTAPVSGATVAGGGSSATTADDGYATIALPSTGHSTLQATATGYVRSATEPVCAYDPGAGGCDVPAPSPAAAGAPAQAAPVDTRLPVASVRGIRDRQRFRWRRAPRMLRGTVEPGGAGLHAVRFRLRRAAGKRCWFYSAKVERFRRGRCAATWFYYRLGDRPAWEYLLPSRLGAGRYVLDVRVMDRWGREVSKRVRFTVLGRRR